MPKLYTVQEVSERLNVRKDTINRWCKQGRLPEGLAAFKVGRSWRIYVTRKGLNNGQ